MEDRVSLMVLLLTAWTATSTLSAQLSQNVVEAPEPNDTTSTATTLPCGRQGFGEIVSVPGTSDEDLWQFSLPSSSAVLVLVSPRDDDSSFLFDAMDAGGATVANLDDDIVCGGVGGGLSCNSMLRIELGAGDYFVRVIGGERLGSLVVPANGGRYALDVVCLPSSGGQGCASTSAFAEVEPNDDSLSAQPVALCDVVSGSVLGTDLFRLDLSARTAFLVDADILGSLTAFFSGVLLAEDGLSSIEVFVQRPGTNTFRMRRVLDSGTYFIQLSGPSFLGFYDYTLRLSGQTLAPGDVMADEERLGLACAGSLTGGFVVRTIPGEVPLVGSTYSVQFAGPGPLSGSAFALLSTQLFPGTGLDLSVLGSPGCRLYLPPDIVFPIGDPATNSIPAVLGFEWFFPSDPAFVGQRLGIQAVLAIDNGAGPLELITSNVRLATLGNWVPN